MGWLSSSDTLSPAATMHTRFESAEQAILWCERNGVALEVSPSATGAGKPGAVDNQYAYNFLARDVMARMKRAGPRASTAIFAYAAPRRAAFVNQRTTPFGAEKWAPSSASGQTAAAWTGPAWPGPVKPAH